MTANKTNADSLFNAQLFLDDTRIEETAQMGQVWHPARKYPDPILEAENS